MLITIADPTDSTYEERIRIQSVAMLSRGRLAVLGLAPGEELFDGPIA
jgi:hypothetical protein